MIFFYMSELPLCSSYSFPSWPLPLALLSLAPPLHCLWTIFISSASTEALTNFNAGEASSMGLTYQLSMGPCHINTQRQSLELLSLWASPTRTKHKSKKVLKLLNILLTILKITYGFLTIMRVVIATSITSIYKILCAFVSATPSTDSLV